MRSANDENMGEISATKGRIHSIYTGGMVDGPGIRTVVFFAGCNLRCKYCHNPDTWSTQDGYVMTAAEVLTEVLKYKSYYKHSGGGVTLSGGDPLLQFNFLDAVLQTCRENNIHTVLDTSGCTSESTARKILTNTDLVLLDIKSFNPEAYLNLTKQPLEKTLNFLKISAEMNVPVRVRYVLVPNYTDNQDEIEALANYLQDFKNIEKIEVLPFHKKGEYKWAELGLKYELAEVQPPSTEETARVQACLARVKLPQNK